MESRRVGGMDSSQKCVRNACRLDRINEFLGCIMSPWLFNVYMDGVMKEVKMGMGRRGSEIPGGWERVENTWPLVCR